MFVILVTIKPFNPTFPSKHVQCNDDSDGRKSPPERRFLIFHAIQQPPRYQQLPLKIYNTV
jgi:hypothetical protein